MTPCLNPVCNAPNAPDAKFCMKCGTKLLIQDRYRPSKALGEGSFGKTFLAVDQGKPSQPQCVIKQFTFTSTNPDFVQKAKDLFYEEAKQLEKLGKHPQIPELYGYCEQENRLYLIQEYVDGENLLDELDRTGVFNEAKIRQVLADLLSVLQFLHEHQVIHRDIKPENIMRRQSDQKLVLIDFGAVKQTTATSLQRTGTTIGSLAYQAPEQGLGKAVFSSDLYSLGVSCLQLLTNKEPYDLYDVQEGEFVWQHYLLTKILEDNLGKVLDRMTQGAIKQRYRSVQEIVQALNPITPTINLTVQTLTVKTSSDNFTENLGDGVKLEMIAIPGGKFLMGSTESSNEKPLHTVTVPPFYIGKYPVTQEQYQVLIGRNYSRFNAIQHPIDSLSWKDATEFCQILSYITGKNYRLPSEAEWEYACRAGTHTRYYFGHDEDKLKDYAWYIKNSENTTHPVGEKKPNNWGLYDMHGNIWEWCSDRWHDNYEQAPTDGSSWEISMVDTRVLRGTHWGGYAELCRSALRHHYTDSYSCGGFRVVCDSVLPRTL